MQRQSSSIRVTAKHVSPKWQAALDNNPTVTVECWTHITAHWSASHPCMGTGREFQTPECAARDLLTSHGYTDIQLGKSDHEMAVSSDARFAVNALSPLVTTHTPKGIALTFDDGEEGGMLIPEKDWSVPHILTCWRFTSPDGSFDGPLRATKKAAEYDALAYWEDKYARR